MGAASSELYCPCTKPDCPDGCGKKLELMRLHYLPSECAKAFDVRLLESAKTSYQGDALASADAPAFLQGDARKGAEGEDEGKGKDEGKEEGKWKEEGEREREGEEEGEGEGKGEGKNACDGECERLDVCYTTSEALAKPEGMHLFQRQWKRGLPFVVHNVKGKMRWTPHLMKRAATEKRKGEYTADVIDCSAHQVIEVSIEAFFNGYTGETRFGTYEKGRVRACVRARVSVYLVP